LRRKESNTSIWSLSLLIVLAFLAIFSAACSSKSPSAAEPLVRTSEPGTNFGDELLLSGYSESTRDGHAEIELRWKAIRKPTADYNVFIHALGGPGPGRILFQLDHTLKNSAGAPTSSWTPGESVSDRFLAIPPPSQSPGAYTLRLGVNFVKPMKLLLVVQSTLPESKDDWKGAAIQLEHVDCR
jgi:hypothetical protein